MAFTVELVGELSVRSNGSELPPPPDKTVATLFLGLLDAEDHWIGRGTTASLLYPGSARAAGLNALRQTIFRLNLWLGSGSLESRNGSIRLTPGRFEATWNPPDGGLASGLGGIAPGLDHSWVDAIRARRTKQQSDPQSALHSDFIRAVESAASVDRDTARKILIGGSEIAVNLTSQETSLLLGLTQATDRRNPLVFEHLMLRAFLHAKAGAVRQSTEAYMRAFRLGSHQRQQAKMAQAAAMVMFMCVESGDMGGAAMWLDRFHSTDRTATVRLLLANARAAFLWNSNRLQEALEIMTAAVPAIQAVDRAQSVHFWTNLSALSAEAGDIELQLHAEAEGRNLAVPAIDFWSLMTLDFSAATRMMAQGLLDQAIETLGRLKAKAEAAGHYAGCWYILEAQAEALAHAGEISRAVQAWNQVESARRAAGCRLTPRLAARKTRIMRYA